MKNIIVFLTDDHGQWALGSSGCRAIQTPNLDRLAAEGAVMENAFTPTPVCSPARACFLTGRTSSQHGIHDYLDGREEAFTRDWLRGQPTIGEILGNAGYQTGLVGKWHLGNDTRVQHGFQSWFSLAGDFPIDATGPARYSNNGVIETITGSKADVLTDAALRFLEGSDPTRPFFLFVSHVSTHSAWEGHPEELVARYREFDFPDIPQDVEYPFGIQNLESRELIDRSNPREALAQYYAAVTNIDQGVGRVVDALKQMGILDETLVVYTSDHGLNCGHHGIWGKGNGTLPLNFVEETIRVPLVLRHPDGVKPGLRHDIFVDHLDLFQTVLDFADVNPPHFDYAGRSYLATLSQITLPEHWRDVQFCEYGSEQMIRTTRFKLIDRLSPARAQLFDLLIDPFETTDVADNLRYQEVKELLSLRLREHYQRYCSADNFGRRLQGPKPTNSTSPWAPKATEGG